MAGAAKVSDLILDEGAKGWSVPVGGPGRAVWEALMQAAVDVAVRAYEDLSPVQRERVLEESGNVPAQARSALVDVLRRARDFAGAARLLEAHGADAQAAALHEQAGALMLAAEAWLRAGEKARAAAAFESAGALERALELYRALDARESMAQCLTRLQRPLEAAELYHALGYAHAELEALRGVPPEHPRRREAVLRMCALLDEQGESWRALVLLADARQESADARADEVLQAEHLRLLRHLGLGDGTSSSHESAPVTERASAAPDGYEYLKAIPIFGELALEDLKDLFRMAQQVAIPEDTTVLEKGARGTGLLVLLEGTVDVSSGPGLDARRLNTLGPGAWLGEISLILDGPTSAHVRSRSAVRALRVTRADFQHYLATHEAAALRIYRLFTHNLAERVRALSA
ncbi:cyclic nucleotide-binding domain-containing protein [Myxococcus sp. CA051A]|uniref:cyclic nucleotide-binding domain-containing protein n=1 Tax=unclassified Myxococcus TaxID=2648731 RepID=UPI00157B4D3F|nr:MULTISPECIES: cyclic nucleotide-binding domain-containing protein [unclassified Myxococcus]NTX11039.1 cyclic nucleotide-binding domain-containing protein [Myxococcus sp. CA056]NTX40864.1 cyclic nucleotide-binding domain-containing protein [Myxococcus sp. CA033]NTX50455.1 cyclic nucleotide-binding domain-containing protein [Myxococcus sp. CA039A]NTX60314.1 cyclic nucleotide-binding domain-containing protein [Myxococcus sp. CA051A]